MTAVKITDLSFFYGKAPVFSGISGHILDDGITAVTGRSGIGKTTFLMTLNRLWEDIPGGAMTGSVKISLESGLTDIYTSGMSRSEVRRRVGMVFQHPNPLPMSIYKNMSFGLRVAGKTSKKQTVNAVEHALKRAALWDEVKDRLHDDARKLSGGQQQRLCIARALVTGPRILLLDEPTASLDAHSVEKIEDLMHDLKDSCTLIMVSHDAAQVGRMADHVWEFASQLP